MTIGGTEGDSGAPWGQIRPAERSFVVRERWSARSAREWPLLHPHWGLDRAAAVSWRPEALDIGVGDGESTVALLDQLPGRRVLAVDVYRPGLLHLMRAADARGSSDEIGLRVHHGDVTALADLLPAGSLVRVNVFFPDPWPKRKHHRRRLIRRPFADTLVDLLAPGGILHLATDWESYADTSRTALAHRADLAPCEAPPRPITKFAERAVAAGRPLLDLAWRRTRSV